MTYEELHRLLNDPTSLTEHHKSDLEYLSTQYPYCAPLHRLLILCLYQTQDLQYASDLPRRSLFLSSPEYLFFALKQRRDNVSSSPIKEENKGFALIDSFLEAHPEDTSEVEQLLSSLSPLPVREKENTEELITTFLEKGISAEQIRIEEPNENKPAYLNKIEDSPLEEELFTETLARIYIRQGRYERAMNIFQTLNLKMPKKNSYFAEQIEFLDKILSMQQASFPNVIGRGKSKETE